MASLIAETNQAQLRVEQSIIPAYQSSLRSSIISTCRPQKMRSASWGDFPIIHSIIFFLSCCVSCVKETLKITTPCFMMLACVRSEGHIQRPFSCFLYSLSQSKPSLPSPSRGSKFSDGDPASKRPFRWPSREVATLRKKFEVFLLVNSQDLYAFLRGMMHHS